MTFRPITIDGIGSFPLTSQAAPSLQWIAITDLVIDGSYQAPPSGGYGDDPSGSTGGRRDFDEDIPF